jgi:hypothetical protein
MIETERQYNERLKLGHQVRPITSRGAAFGIRFLDSDTIGGLSNRELLRVSNAVTSYGFSGFFA